jgi:hypothetical protein
METIFESIKEEKGYFTLHANVDKKLIYYGFITEKSSYYDPKIFIDNPDDPFINIDEKDEGDEDEDDEIIVCYAKISTSNENKFNRWLDRQMRKGCYVEIEYNKVTGIWKGDSRNPDNWKDPYQR